MNANYPHRHKGNRNANGFAGDFKRSRCAVSGGARGFQRLWGIFRNDNDRLPAASGDLPRLSDAAGSAIVLSFTIVALVFTGVGVYGLVSFAVSTRRKECGIRIALGATRANVSRVMAMQGLRPVAAGLTVGVFGGFGAETVLDHYGFLYPVAADRTPMVVAAVILVSVITAAACLFPALRASQVQALPLLRQD